MKRLLLIIFAVFFVKTTVSFADYSQSFDDTAPGAFPEEYNIYSRGHTIGVEGAHNRYGAIQIDMTNTTGSPYVEYRKLSVDDTTKTVFEFSLMVENSDRLCSNIVVIKNSNNDMVRFLKIYNGDVYLNNGSVIARNLIDGYFYNFAVVVDLTENKYSVFMDSVEIATDISLGAYSASDITVLRFMTLDLKDGCKNKFCFDNISVYQGETPSFKRGVHPAVLGNSEIFGKIKNMYNSGDDLTLKSWCSSIINDAKIYTRLNVLSEYKMTDSIRMLSPIRRCGAVIEKCAFAYKITGNTEYAERAWREIENFCDDTSWPDWNPYQMLGVGEAMYNCAIAYDWLYDYLDDEQKNTIRSALSRKAWRHYYNDVNGLSYSNNAVGRTSTPYETEAEELIRSSLWRSFPRQNNWNFVVNGGVIVSAVATEKENCEEAVAIKQMAIDDLPPALLGFAPDGAWFEGQNYWEYSSEFLINIIETLKNADKTDYNISDSAGLSNTANYYFAMMGPGGAFNFSDSPKDNSYPEDLLWFAGRFNNLDFFSRVIASYKSSNTLGGVRAMMWYAAAKDRLTINEPPELDNYFRDVETVTLRSDYSDGANYFGIHGGKNSDAHAHLDSGTFVLDSDGTRFALDLGSDNYNLTGGMNIYRKSAQGHNVMVFNPTDKGYGQSMDNNSKILKFRSGEASAFAICDLSDAYSKSYISEYKRGIKLLDNKTKFIVQDEFVSKTTIADAYWFWHTDAEISLSEDKRSAILTKEGKSLTLKILSDIDGVFSVMEPVGIPGSPVAKYDGQEGQYSNEGIKKLAIHMTNVSGYNTICVGAYTDNEAPKYFPMEEWGIDGSTVEPIISCLSVDNSLLADFDSKIKSYNIPCSTIPQITAFSNFNTVSVKPNCLNSNQYVYVISPEGIFTRYKLYLDSPENDTIPVSDKLLVLISIYDKDGHLINVKTDRIYCPEGSEIICENWEENENQVAFYLWKEENLFPVSSKQLIYKRRQQ